MYLSEYSIKRDFSWVFGISWESETSQYVKEARSGYHWKYSELRTQMVPINRRKDWIHTLNEFDKIGRFSKKITFFGCNFSIKSLRSSN